MSSRNWKSFCRLCAREEKTEHKLDTAKSLSDVLMKYFQISISIDDCLTSVCQECLDFVLNVKKFALRCTKVNKMFLKRLGDDLVLEQGPSNLPENEEHKENSVIEDPLLSYVNFLKIEPVDFSDSESGKLDLNERNESIYTDVDTVCEYNENMDVRDVADHRHEVDNADENVSCEQELQSIDERANSNKASATKNSAQTNTTCKLCGKTLLSHGLYKRHMRTKHSPTVPRFTCTKCHKCFVSKKNLIEHEGVHLPDHLKKTIPCPYCKKEFRTAKTVSIHVRFIHSNERPYICEECGKSFATSGCLTQHNVTHVKERSWQCPHCPSKFKGLVHLRKHMDIHNDDAHVCPDCGKQMNTKRNLRVHMLVHSDQKKYKCQFCDFEFKRAYTLKRHLEIHSGMRPFKCSFCEKHFTHSTRQRGHEKIYHPNEYASKQSESVIV